MIRLQQSMLKLNSTVENNIYTTTENCYEYSLNQYCSTGCKPLLGQYLVNLNVYDFKWDVKGLTAWSFLPGFLH